MFTVKFDTAELDKLLEETKGKASAARIRKVLSDAAYGAMEVIRAEAIKLTRKGGGVFKHTALQYNPPRWMKKPKVSPGTLSRSLRTTRKRGQLFATMTSTVPYAHIQAYGGRTKPHWIFPKKQGGVLVFPTGKGGVSNIKKVGRGKGKLRSITARTRSKNIQGYTIAEFVRHPGSRIKGTKYPQQAYVRVRAQVQQALFDAGRKLLD